MRMRTRRHFGVGDAATMRASEYGQERHMGMHALNGSRRVGLGLPFFLSMLLGARAFVGEQATAVLARVSG
jgi:hypothetical protein